MNTKILLTALEQVSILLIFIFLGYFLRKKNIINENGKKVLASLLTCVFAPAYSIASLSSQVTVDKFVGDYLPLFIAGSVVTLVCIFIVKPLVKLLAKDNSEKNILKYALAFGNITYFGYPLIEAVFGQVARAQMIFFCVPMSIAIYTYGYYILTLPAREKNACSKKQSLAKKLSFIYSPMMLGAIIGVSLGLLTSGFNFSLPTVVNGVIEKAGACQSATAMLLTGAVLANVPLKKLFTSFKPYVVGVIRLVVMPLLFSGILAMLYLLGWQDATFMKIAMLTLIVVGMPVGMNTVVYPESAGIDSTEGAKTCFISYILALIAIPIVYSVAMSILTVSFV